MDKPPPSMRTLAQQLLAMEAAKKTASCADVHEAVRVCELLRISLTRFAGPDGFTALMRRAVALARAEVPALRGVQVKADGSLEGLQELVIDSRNDGVEASTAVTTHFLGLLVTFVGEPITFRLVREAWPEASFDE